MLRAMSCRNVQSSWWLAAALVVPVVACAQGQDASDDDDDDVVVDARVIDGSAIDGPDVEIDAAEVDASLIDATVIDAVAIDGAVIDGAVVDATPIDGAVTDAMTDAPIDGGPIGNADTCATAVDITAAAMMGAGTTINGNLTGFANNIQPASSCTGYTNDGPDAIYVLSNLTAGRTITATVSAPTWDSAVEIVQPCTLTPTCLVGRDVSDPESVTYTTTAAGTFYVIVDSWDVGSYGPYTLTVRVQ
jgi:hypothetical protein